MAVGYSSEPSQSGSGPLPMDQCQAVVVCRNGYRENQTDGFASVYLRIVPARRRSLLDMSDGHFGSLSPSLRTRDLVRMLVEFDALEANTTNSPHHGARVVPVLLRTRLSSLRVCKQRKLRLVSQLQISLCHVTGKQTRTYACGNSNLAVCATTHF